MGRIRTIKPEILEDEKTAHLDDRAWRLFVSLFLLADDYGNMRGSPAWIQGQVFWADDSRDIRETLARLSRESLIRPYVVRGQSYITITNWSKHQKVDKPGKPRVPGPEEADDAEREDAKTGTCAVSSRKSRESSRQSRESLAPDPDPEGDHINPPNPPRGDDAVPPPKGRQVKKPRAQLAGWGSDQETELLHAWTSRRSAFPNSNREPPAIGTKSGRALRRRWMDAREDVSADDLCASIRGHAKSEFHRRNGYTGVAYALRHENIARFVALDRGDVEPNQDLQSEKRLPYWKQQEIDAEARQMAEDEALFATERPH